MTRVPCPYHDEQDEVYALEIAHRALCDMMPYWNEVETDDAVFQLADALSISLCDAYAKLGKEAARGLPS